MNSPTAYLIHTEQALIRDGYRCVVTKKYDMTSVLQIRGLNEMVSSDPNARGDPTHCAHIFSESTNLNFEPGSDKVCLPFRFFFAR
jgi:hypothetical protein